MRCVEGERSQEAPAAASWYGVTDGPVGVATAWARDTEEQPPMPCRQCWGSS